MRKFYPVKMYKCYGGTREEMLIPLVKYSFNLQSLSSSAPCAPTTLHIRMQKIGQSHWAMVSWDSVNCSDVEYLLEMTGRMQNNPQALMEITSYWLPRTYFELPMPCSTSYNVTVRAKNSAGVSEPSMAHTGVSGNFTLRPSLILYRGEWSQ